MRRTKHIIASRLTHCLKPDPIDLCTEEGRAQQRHRQILLTTVSSAVAKILAAAISFALIPLLLNYLGKERFGLWMTISATVAMLGITDLGIGSGLMNAVAKANGQNDVQKIRTNTGIGLLLLSVIALLITTSFLLVAQFVPWNKIFNLNNGLAVEEATPTIVVVALCFALSMPAGIVFRVQMGLQKGFSANLWLSGASILGLIGVLVVIHFEGGLPYLAAAIVSPPAIAGLAASLYFWILQERRYRPKFTGFTINAIKGLTTASGLFFLLQIFSLIAFNSDNLILAYFLGPESVAIYSVSFKLFTLPSIVIGFFLYALWPAYAEANSRGDKKWIYVSFLKSLKYSFAIVLPLSLSLLIKGEWIISLWVGESIKPPFDLLVGLFFWSVLTAFGGNISALLNGLGVIKFQLVTGLAMVISNVVLSVFLVGAIGISGVVWGSVFSLAIVQYLPSVFYLRAKFK